MLNDNILVDIGVPYKLIEPYANKIKLVLLTHQHGDHFKPSTVRTLHKQHPATRWGCCEWMVGPLLDAGVDKRVIGVVNLIGGRDIGGLSYPDLDVIIYPEMIPHNVPNCAWHIGLPGGESVFYSTDCSSLDHIKAKEYSLYMVESNHTRAEIEARIAAKRAAGEFAYEVEACRNHLSREQALDWLAANMGPDSQYVFLHQHIEKGGGADEKRD